MKKARPSAKNNWGCSSEWKTAPISPTCQVMIGRLCGRPTDLAYPAMGGGWMSLCLKHGLKHVRHGGALKVEVLIKGGEKFE
jgi:hypothetical protein